MITQDYIAKKYGVDLSQPSPISLPYRRDELAVLFNEFGYRSGAEIGVDRGLYSELLCQKNPGVKLYCIDPWKVYRKYRDFDSQRLLDKNYEETKQRLAPYNCEIIKKSSMGAIGDFKPESLDFVYLDGNHAYEYVLEDIRGWSKIVKPGGIVSGHDYKCFKYKQIGFDVSSAVNLYVKENDIKTFFVYTLNRSTTWFFCK